MLKSHVRPLQLATLAALFTVVFVLPALPANAKDGVRGVEGTLTSVDPSAGTLTIRNRLNQEVAIATNSTTKIERNDRRATLAAFKLGDRVEAKFLTTAGDLAFKVEAVGP